VLKVPPTGMQMELDVMSRGNNLLGKTTHGGIAEKVMIEGFDEKSGR